MKIKAFLLLTSIFWLYKSYSQNVFPATGNVGIGTASPTENLSVEGSGRFAKGLYVNNVGYRLESNSTDLINNATWYGLGKSSIVLGSEPTNRTAIQLAGYYGLNLKTGGGDLVMLRNGNVGIGTINPTAKLAVNGLMKAKEVNVTISGSDWPDYVFKPDYKQPDLTQLAKDIQQQGHLPGIPSAGEIRESGVNVGVMEAKLLEKIEQLTLLLIEQDKKLTSFQKELEILREKK